MEFRDLRADEISCRVAQISDKGLSLLLYKDARCDMNILDEKVGSEKWQRSHEVINGNLFCNVGIYFDDIGWVFKQDVGVESKTEEEKGQASDAFKRACFNWGIGRELYTAPFIWITPDNYTVTKKSDGKPTTYDKFEVEDIEIKDKKIMSVAIKNAKRGTTVYRWSLMKDVPKNEQKAENKPSEAPQPMQEADDNALLVHRAAIRRYAEGKHVNVDALLSNMKKTPLDEMDIKNLIAFKTWLTGKYGE